ncbi:unnamed protein product [Calypogeia fissa]
MKTTSSAQRASQSVPQTAPSPQRFSQSAPQAQASSPQRASQSTPSRRNSASKPPLPSPRRASNAQNSSAQRASQVSPSPNSAGSRRGSKSSEPVPSQTPAQPDTLQNASGTPPPPQVALPMQRSSQIVLAPQPPLVATSAPQLQSSSSISTQTSPRFATTLEASSEVTQSKVEAPGEEKEPEWAGPFREKPEMKIMRRISLEMRHRMYLMGMRIQYSETGPVACNFYVMGEIGKTFIVKIRKFPCCQCGDFLLQRLCKHMMFVSLRVFRLEQSDDRIWQQALLPKELSVLMAHPLITPPTKPPFRSKLRKPPPPDPPGPPKPETPICCPICFDEIQFFDNEVKKPLGAKRGPKPKLEMGTRRKKGDKVKVEEALAEPWAERIKKFEPLLHCPQQHCQVDGCMKIVHQYCYLKWNRFKKMSYDLPQICTPNNFYPCAFTCH